MVAEAGRTNEKQGCQGWVPAFGLLFTEMQTGGRGELQEPELAAATCDFLQGRPQTLMMFSVCFLPQRAKISQGTKAPEEKTTNTISKLDNNGNRDRMKLTDFNFLMVLGKGSFGKVCLQQREQQVHRS